MPPSPTDPAQALRSAASARGPQVGSASGDESAPFNVEAAGGQLGRPEDKSYSEGKINVKPDGQTSDGAVLVSQRREVAAAKAEAEARTAAEADTALRNDMTARVVAPQTVRRSPVCLLKPHSCSMRALINGTWHGIDPTRA